MINKLNKFQELKKQKGNIVRRDQLIRTWYKSGVLGAESPERKPTSKVYKQIR